VWGGGCRAKIEPRNHGVLQTYLFNLPQVIAIMLSQNNYMTHLALNYYYYTKLATSHKLDMGLLDN